MCLYFSGLRALGTKKINQWVYAQGICLCTYLAHIRKTQIPKFFLMVPMQVNVFGMINFGNLAISSSLVIKQESMEPIMCNGAFVVIWSESRPTHSLKPTMYMYVASPSCIFERISVYIYTYSRVRLTPLPLTPIWETIESAKKEELRQQGNLLLLPRVCHEKCWHMYISARVPISSYEHHIICT